MAEVPLMEVSLVRFPMIERYRFRLRDRFAEAERVSRGAKLEAAWCAMVEWFAEQDAIRAQLALLGVQMEDDE